MKLPVAATPAGAAKGSWAERLPLAAQIAGLATGLLPWLMQGPEVSLHTSLFRLLAFPFLGGLSFWALAVGLARPGGAARGAEFAAWLKGAVRPGQWAPPAALLLLALACWLAAGGAQTRLINWYQNQAAPRPLGFLGLFYDAPSWSPAPKEHWLAGKVDLIAQRPALASRPIFSTRHLALLKLNREADIEFKLTSDDGALLLVDGLRRINNLGLHSPRQKREKLHLAAGPHAIEVLHFQERGGAMLRLELNPAQDGRLFPLRPGFASHALWVLDKEAQNWANRALLLLCLGLGLAGLNLLPFPKDWFGAARAWLKDGWPYLAICAGLAGLSAWGLNSWPGVDGDSGRHGLLGADWYWRARFRPPWAGYANQELFTWPSLWLQHFFSLSVAMLRWFSTACNLAGLLLLAGAARKWTGRAGSFAAVAVVGFSALFLFSNRHFIDPYTYGFLGAGLAFFGLSRGRAWWGAPLCASGLSLLWQTHGVFVPMVAGFGVLVVLVAGPRVLWNWRFWLGALVLAAWNHAWLAAYLNGAMSHPSPPFSWAGFWGQVQGIFLQTMGLLSGSRLALYAAGREAWYIPPLVPLALLACLPLWPFAKLGRRGSLLLVSLAAMALVTLLVGGLVVRGQEIRYAYPLALILLLWLGLFLGLAVGRAQGARRPLALAACLLAACGVYGFLAWLTPFSQHGGSYARVPGASFNSERMIDKRELYQALARQEHKVFFPHWDGFSLLFHETEDITGRRGVEMAQAEEPGVLAVYYRFEKAKVPAYGEPYDLGPRLNRLYLAYVVRGSKKTP